MEVLERVQRLGQLWVALNDEAPVGFAHVEIFESGSAHLDEIDVHPDHGRRGLGTRLVQAVCDWAASKGYRSVTLPTFRDVPWNMPFYARLGFEVLPPEPLTPALRTVVEDETRRGLDPNTRVVMQRLVPEVANTSISVAIFSPHLDRRRPTERAPLQDERPVPRVARGNRYRELVDRRRKRSRLYACFSDVARTVVLRAPLPGLCVHDEVHSVLMGDRPQRVGSRGQADTSELHRRRRILYPGD